MPDTQFVPPLGTTSAPATWNLQAILAIVPKIAFAHYDGTSAAGSFRPCLRVISDSGHVAAECVSEVIVAAGASADVTWFPGADLDDDATSHASVGITSEVVFVDSKTSTPTIATTTLAAGTTYLLVVEGDWSFWNEALDVGSPNANAMFPSSTAGRVSTQVGVDAETLYAYPSAHPNSIGHQAGFQISLDGGGTFAHIEPDGGPYATPNNGHLYRYTVTGQGHPPQFQIVDTIFYPDNYGQLRVTIQVPSGTGTGSGAGSLLPPADTTNNGQVPVVLAGVPAWADVDGGSA